MIFSKMIAAMTGPWGGSDSSGNDPKPDETGKPRSPWEDTRKKAGPKPGGPPPNLEELLRRHERAYRQNKQNQKPFKPPFGSDAKTQKNILLALAAGFLLLWISSGFYRVEPDEQGVVLRFGEVVRLAPPGFGYHWPMPIETVLTPKVTRVNRTEIDFKNGPNDKEKNLIMTKDENIIDVDFVVNWQIKDAKDYLFNVRDPEATIKMAAESVMREVMGQTGIQSALTEGRQRVEQETLKELQALLDEYKTGVQVLQIQLQKVDPPQAVIEAFRDVQRARAEKERASNDAIGYANDIVPRAKGDAERMRAEAEAYKEQIVSRAKGEAERFSDIYQAYKAAPGITAKRMYLETMEQVMKQSKRVILDGDAKAQGGMSVMPVLPMDILRQNNAAPSAKGAN